MDDDAHVLGAAGNADIEVRAIIIVPGYGNGASVVCARVLGSVVEGVDSPTHIVVVRPEIVNAYVTCRYLSQGRERAEGECGE